MQQQTIIISAIVLALILAGVLWYTLTQSPSSDVALSSPFPTPTVTTGAVPPSAAVETPAPAITNTPSGPTPVLSPTPAIVQPTAYTGPTSIVFFITIGSMMVGLWGLHEALKRS